MSPRKSRRRRIFAAPFVLTLALAPACIVKEAQPPQSQTQQQTETRYDQNGNEILTKPTTTKAPPVKGETMTPEGAGSGSGSGPVVISNPPPPKPLPAAPKDSAGKIVASSDGTCWFHYTVKCPPKAICNPPPPMQVQCEK